MGENIRQSFQADLGDDALQRNSVIDERPNGVRRHSQGLSRDNFMLQSGTTDERPLYVRRNSYTDARENLVQRPPIDCEVTFEKYQPIDEGIDYSHTHQNGGFHTHPRQVDMEIILEQNRNQADKMGSIKPNITVGEGMTFMGGRKPSSRINLQPNVSLNGGTNMRQSCQPENGGHFDLIAGLHNGNTFTQKSIGMRQDGQINKVGNFRQDSQLKARKQNKNSLSQENYMLSNPLFHQPRIQGKTSKQTMENRTFEENNNPSQETFVQTLGQVVAEKAKLTRRVPEGYEVNYKGLFVRKKPVVTNLPLERVEQLSETLSSTRVIGRFPNWNPSKTDIEPWIKDMNENGLPVTFNRLMGNGCFMINVPDKEVQNAVIGLGPQFIGEHLCLLHKWMPNFSPTSPSNAKYGIWVSLQYLPEEMRPFIGELLKPLGEVLQVVPNVGDGIHSHACVAIDLEKFDPEISYTGPDGCLYKQTIDIHGVPIRCWLCKSPSHGSEHCPKGVLGGFQPDAQNSKFVENTSEEPECNASKLPNTHHDIGHGVSNACCLCKSSSQGIDNNSRRFIDDPQSKGCDKQEISYTETEWKRLNPVQYPHWHKTMNMHSCYTPLKDQNSSLREGIHSHSCIASHLSNLDTKPHSNFSHEGKEDEDCLQEESNVRNRVNPSFWLCKSSAHCKGNCLRNYPKKFAVDGKNSLNPPQHAIQLIQESNCNKLAKGDESHLNMRSLHPMGGGVHCLSEDVYSIHCRVPNLEQENLSLPHTERTNPLDCLHCNCISENQPNCPRDTCVELEDNVCKSNFLDCSSDASTGCALGEIQDLVMANSGIELTYPQFRDIMIQTDIVAGVHHGSKHVNKKISLSHSQMKQNPWIPPSTRAPSKPVSQTKTITNLKFTKTRNLSNLSEKRLSYIHDYPKAQTNGQPNLPGGVNDSNANRTTELKSYCTQTNQRNSVINGKSLRAQNTMQSVALQKGCPSYQLANRNKPFEKQAIEINLNFGGNLKSHSSASSSKSSQSSGKVQHILLFEQPIDLQSNLNNRMTTSCEDCEQFNPHKQNKSVQCVIETLELDLTPSLHQQQSQEATLITMCDKKADKYSKLNGLNRIDKSQMTHVYESYTMPPEPEIVHDHHEELHHHEELQPCTSIEDKCCQTTFCAELHPNYTTYTPTNSNEYRRESRSLQIAKEAEKDLLSRQSSRSTMDSIASHPHGKNKEHFRHKSNGNIASKCTISHPNPSMDHEKNKPFEPTPNQNFPCTCDDIYKVSGSKDTYSNHTLDAPKRQDYNDNKDMRNINSGSEINSPTLDPKGENAPSKATTNAISDSSTRKGCWSCCGGRNVQKQGMIAQS